MEITTLYMPLLGEGVAVWRPVLAQPLADTTFRIIANQPYDPDDEQWAFPPGSIVRCREQVLSRGRCLVAFERVLSANSP